MSALRQRRTRFKQRGAAALEFALSTVFLIPLILGTLDFGYYFWVSVNAAEAAKEAGWRLRGPRRVSTTAWPSPKLAANRRRDRGRTARAIGYMAAAGAGLPVPTVDGHLRERPGPQGSFSTVVTVNFQPLVGFVKAMMPAGTPSGYVRYQSRLSSRPERVAESGRSSALHPPATAAAATDGPVDSSNSGNQRTPRCLSRSRS